MKILKNEHGGRPPFKNLFGHNSAAAHYPISMELCTGKQNSMAIEATKHKL